MDMLDCPNCGKRIPASSRACPECFHFLGAKEAAAVCWKCRAFWTAVTIVAFILVLLLRH